MKEIKRIKNTSNLCNGDGREKDLADNKKHGTPAHQYIRRDGRVSQSDEQYEGTWVWSWVSDRRKLLHAYQSREVHLKRKDSSSCSLSRREDLERKMSYFRWFVCTRWVTNERKLIRRDKHFSESFQRWQLESGIRTPYLRQVILGDRQDTKDLVQYTIESLSENITDGNTQLIIEFVWNLTQIDPDDPSLVSHGDRLLAQLIRVSSSLIESSSSISLSLHEFDLLLLLSRRPSNTATSEQLCSILKVL